MQNGPAKYLCCLWAHRALSAAIASLKDKGFRRRTIEFIKREKAFLMEGIDKIGGGKGA